MTADRTSYLRSVVFEPKIKLLTNPPNSERATMNTKDHGNSCRFRAPFEVLPYPTDLRFKVSFRQGCVLVRNPSTVGV